MKEIILLLLVISFSAVSIYAINAYGQGQDQGLQKFVDRVNQAKLASKEIKKGIDEQRAYAQNEPEVLAKRDKYNQTYYDCFNSADAFMMAFSGEIDWALHDQALNECHFFYNETGVWVGANPDIDYTADPKFDIASKKLSQIKQQDEILEADIRAHRNDTVFDDKIQDFFGGLFK
jgi:hypothetical protein